MRTAVLVQCYGRSASDASVERSRRGVTPPPFWMCPPSPTVLETLASKRGCVGVLVCCVARYLVYGIRCLCVVVAPVVRAVLVDAAVIIVMRLPHVHDLFIVW